MLILLLALFMLFPHAAFSQTVAGRGAPSVQIPRIEEDVQVDGNLDEPAWGRALRLGEFSQYRPVDSRPAEERTEILVWYSPSAIYFGILAFDSQPDAVRATVADRDNLQSDDTVTIYLDTFNDRRRAFYFTVNPLGVQEDGVQSEGAFNAGSLMGGTTDRNPDFRFDSRGHLTAEGYAVEMRIPFKSLRYNGTGPQSWGFNVRRKTQRTGYEDTWTDVKRAGASFLAQAGTLEGLHDLKRGAVFEAQPVLTAAWDGKRDTSGRFHRTAVDWNPGANFRLGFTNLSLDATVNPDFSQVESDVGQVTANQRFALFYPEKRPFFLEGIELFSTPNQLVYTRRVSDPIGGAKITGKMGKWGIAYLAAVDDTSDGYATFNVARLRRDVGSDSLLGITFTDRSAGTEHNQVAAADMRYVFRKLYYVQGQVGGAHTSKGEQDAHAPLWSAEFDRTGRAWGFNYKLNAIGDGFEAQAGFVPRANIVEGHAFNRFSIYGRRGAALESVTVFFGPMRYWSFDGFTRGDAPIEGSESISALVQFKGGSSANVRLQRQFFRLDEAEYRNYRISGPAGTIRAFAPPLLQSGQYGLNIRMSTPVFRSFNASLEVMRTRTPLFQEASEGNETLASVLLGFRPNSQTRIELSNTSAYFRRDRDGSEYSRTLLPRIKLEYQPRRSYFFRIIGEYRSERRAELLDPLSGRPILVSGRISGTQQFSGLRLDILASYEPTPGTVAYLGYGSSLESPFGRGFSDFSRAADGFFLKLAYLFRR